MTLLKYATAMKTSVNAIAHGALSRIEDDHADRGQQQLKSQPQGVHRQRRQAAQRAQPVRAHRHVRRQAAVEITVAQARNFFEEQDAQPHLQPPADPLLDRRQRQFERKQEQDEDSQGGDGEPACRWVGQS